MASFARSALPPRRREWTVEEHALFAARKEFELLRLLSTDKKALATARRLGLSLDDCWIEGCVYNIQRIQRIHVYTEYVCS